jgi:hypothetical protein
MSDLIDFQKDPENAPLQRRIRSYREVIEHTKQQDIKKAIDLLEENGYSVKKIEE